VDAQLAQGLADWLRHQSRLAVVVARDGSRPEPNTVFVAGTSDHLVLGERGFLRYCADPRASPFRPSVDALFASLAEHGPGQGVAALLTGMGADGARGLLTLRQAGWHTIAQDRSTSVIYGMPKAAAELNAATEIVPLPGIAARIVAHVKGRSAAR
jgi:two-component system response regulator WspF